VRKLEVKKKNNNKKRKKRKRIEGVVWGDERELMRRACEWFGSRDSSMEA